MSLTRLQEGIKGGKKEDWACYYSYDMNTENSYREKETIMEDVIINLGDTDYSDGDSDSGTDTKDVESFMFDFIPL